MPTLTYVYSAHSAFAYLGAAEMQRIATSHGATIQHVPILLSPVVEAQGSLPFAARTQPHVDYFFGRDIEHWAEYRSVPIIRQRPTYHDADYSLASRMIIAAGASGPATDTLSHAILQAHWRDDADLSDETTLRTIATETGLDAETLMAQANTPETHTQLTQNTQWAKDTNVFGSPTYIVDGDAFYGQDHLPLVDRALAQPIAPGTWQNPPVG